MGYRPWPLLCWLWVVAPLQRLSNTVNFLHNLQVVVENHCSFSDSRGRCDLSSLGVCEQATPVAPVTSEVDTEEGIESKHHMLLLSLS